MNEKWIAEYKQKKIIIEVSLWSIMGHWSDTKNLLSIKQSLQVSLEACCSQSTVQILEMIIFTVGTLY